MGAASGQEESRGSSYKETMKKTTRWNESVPVRPSHIGGLGSSLPESGVGVKMMSSSFHKIPIKTLLRPVDNDISTSGGFRGF